MTEKELKKLIQVQEKVEKVRSQIDDLVRLHNSLLPEIKMLSNDVAFGTNYIVDDTPYVRDLRIFAISVEDVPFGGTAIGLKALRRPKRAEPEPIVEPEPTPVTRTTRRAASSSKTDRQEHSESE